MFELILGRFLTRAIVDTADVAPADVALLDDPVFTFQLTRALFLFLLVKESVHLRENSTRAQ